jgi:Y_Y_Y domain
METAQREARYPSLPQGSYRFQVAARHANGPWSPVPAAVSFRIVPPWWATWWFRCLAAGACALFIALVVRSRMNRTRYQRGRLESALRERTAELQFQNHVVERQTREIEELFRQARQRQRLSLHRALRLARGPIATPPRLSARRTGPHSLNRQERSLRAPFEP